MRLADLEKDVTILLSQIALTFAKWVDQNLNQCNQQGHQSKLAVLRRFKEWCNAREKGRGCSSM